MIYTIPDHILDELNLTAEEMRQQLTELLVEKRILTAEQAAEVVPLPRVSFPQQTSQSRPKPASSELPQVVLSDKARQLGVWLQKHLATPDDKGAEWWAEFDQMVDEERKKFKVREIEL